MPQPIRQRPAPAATKKESARPNGNRKWAILAILLMTLAALFFIALVTYDPADEQFADRGFSGFWQQGTNLGDENRVHNGLSIVGVILADFLIRSTVGYIVFIVPVLMVLWGWTILRRGDYRRAVTLTNYSIIWALLIASAFGMIRRIFPETGPSMEWSGAVGEFISTYLSRFIGRAGGAIAVCVGMFITAMIGADIDAHQLAERIRSWYLKALDWYDRKRQEREDVGVSDGDEDQGRTDTEGRKEARVQLRKPLADPENDDDDAEQDEAPRPPAPVSIKRRPLEEPPRPQDGPATTRRVLTVTTKVPDLAEEPIAEGAVAPAQPLKVEEIEYVFPPVELLDAPKPGKEDVDEAELQANAELLRETLLQFDVELESVSVTPGPVITLYELVPATGVKISRIVNLENDIALKLAARGIRIMAPIPGKSAVGVEIPNSHRSLVTIRSIINSNVFREAKAALPMAMGKTIAGEVFADDLAKMPHLLVAGSTGSGKSVGINTMIASLLYRMHPSELKFLIIDPKKIELALYSRLKQHFLAVSPDVNEEILTTPGNAVLGLKGAELEMERRYDLFSKAAVRNIADYNEKIASGKVKSTPEQPHIKMPYLVVVIDELADLMITAAREVEEPIARLAQLARAVGIHLIVATQRPSVDVITGVIKANFPARIAYQVASKTDSRTILDMNGAEQLLGNGDMLYLASGSPKPIRLQNAYISSDEVEALMEHIGKQRGYLAPFKLPSVIEKKRSAEGAGGGSHDDLFEEAARIIVRYQQGSVSLLQRRLKVGYSRAARLVDELEAAGIVGPADGSKARDVLVESESELDVILQG
ncbi:MAG: DNA translocase FtsK [Ignavibacteriae bacterium]|nr:DNA translocase FtsK [Ignavibacteriota bacterium]